MKQMKKQNYVISLQFISSHFSLFEHTFYTRTHPGGHSKRRQHQRPMGPFLEVLFRH